MIIGIGTDIVEVKRMKSVCENEKTLHYIFTDEELSYYENKNKRLQTLAGMFAAKEAFAKAMGTGLTGLSLKSINVMHSDSGMPYIFCEGFEKKKIHLSISHEQEYAVATCVIESTNE